MTPVRLILSALALGVAAPALAAVEAMPSPVIALKPPVGMGKVPDQLDMQQRANYRAVFAAIRAGAWDDAAARLDAMPGGLLTPYARAELAIAKGSPKMDSDVLIALIEANRELPQAAQIARLLQGRGVTALPALPVEQGMSRLPGASRRATARSLRSDAVAAALNARIAPLVKDDRPAEAEILLQDKAAELSPDALTELQQRVAWSYFLVGDDAAARRVAASARVGQGDWAVQADWVAGLAAWRQQDCAAAANAFSAVAARSRDTEMTAAGLFWAARAEMACGTPEKVQARLRTAARMTETFYGLLADAALGRVPPAREMGPAFIQADWTTISKRSNARIAAALAEIGESGMADTVLRHQARIGDCLDHEALMHLAAKLGLPGTQIWLSQNGPAGAQISASSRYPAPEWTPQGGWRVDKSLIFAHALQESQFRADAVSPAGARGLMQVMPGTAQLIARRKGEAVGSLSDPRTNIEYGQFYLEELRDASGTGGLLPKVIAAYNAGPGSVVKWNERRRDNGDPLLFIESIPFRETRGYVAIVLRNYWMYQRQAGEQSASLKAMAQGMWPRFPGMPGRTAIRLDPVSGVASAD
ncbi:lytic transglycosylase domain-containing protein [Sphingomonas sp. KC8]|uniref:lytic transglycosylase domain-containing protein n=1 Tax=Sphingomonas sp. KC8 TaxID=1030157 RepID=UPI0002FB1CF9|nr:lytic transglycosylase domain-containing protein [Sphingomonas sp. KC8]ARS26758.1 lytic transglycosylase subunit [Sphingomonas sp. KC8]